MRRSTYMLIGMVLFGFLVTPFLYDYRNRFDESIVIAGKSKLVKYAPVSVMKVVVNDENYSRYDQNIMIESCEGDSIECQYDSDWDKYLTIKENSDTLTFFFDLEKIRTELNAIGSFEVHTSRIVLKVPQNVIKCLNTKECRNFVELEVNNYSTDSLDVSYGWRFTLKNSRIGSLWLSNLGGNVNFIGSNEVNKLHVLLSNNTLYGNGKLDVETLWLEGSGKCEMPEIDADKVIVDAKENEYIEVKFQGKSELDVKACCD